MAIPLTSLAPGEVARLADTHLDTDTRSLLRSLGLTDASRLRVCKRGDRRFRLEDVMRFLAQNR